MSDTLLSAGLDEQAGSDEQIIACPRCAAPLTFSQACLSRIEACGFENYSLDCPTCYSHLEGLFDPADGALILSETTSSKAQLKA